MAVTVSAGAVLCASVGSALAVPADPGARTQLTQPNGAEFTAKPFGDEWANGFETRAGYTVVRDRESRQWQYAERSRGGDLRPSGVAAHREPPQGLRKHLRDEDSVNARAKAEAGLKAPRNVRVATDAASFGRAPDTPNTGSQASVVILAEFTDQNSLGTTPAEWSSRYFGATDSVADYYDEVSFGQLQITPATESHGTANDGVIGWLDLSRAHPQAGDLNEASVRVRETTRDAIVAADPFIDYDSYDTDNSGLVTAEELHITIIPAGREASQSCAGNVVWGHKWGTFDLTPTVDGVGAGMDYTMFGEMHCDPSDHLATLGIMVHEIGHDLDWPDLYDIDYSSQGGVGYWSVMAYGSWLADVGSLAGDHPPHPDAFSKYYQGWTAPVAPTGTATESLGQAATNPDAVRLLENPNGVDWSFPSATSPGQPGTGEYFLVENRQNVGYDVALPGCGLVIWHIDETRDAQAPNAGDSRRMVQLEEADANNSPFGAGDAWLGGVFNGSSNPNSDLYSGAESGAAVGNMDSTCAAEMSAEVTSGGTIPPDTTITSGPANGSTIDDPTPTFEFTSDDPGASFECKVDAGAFAPCTSPHTTAALSEASHLFEVRAKAGDGTVDSSPASRGFTVDLAGADPPETTITGGPAEGETIDDSTPTFGFSSDDAGATFECRIDAGAFAPCTSPHTTAVLSEASHLFEVRAKAADGTVDPSPASRGFNVDLGGSGPPDTTITGGPAEGSTIADSTPTFSFGSDDPGASFECSIDGGPYANCASPYTTPALMEAVHTFTVRASNSAGADPTPPTRTFTVDLPDAVDSVPPETSLTGNPPRKTKKKKATFRFTADEQASFECSLDAADFSPCGSPQTYKGLSKGRHLFQVRATDLAGNTDESPAGYRWKVKKKKKK